MRVAILSDTHGNLTAFEAVLADIENRQVDRIFHLGDVVGKGPRGSACCDLARRYCETTVLGNWDIFLLSSDATGLSESATWWRDEISPENREWLSMLPFSVDFELNATPVRCFHASADDVFHRIYPDVQGKEWDELFLNTEATGDIAPEPTVVIYGDIHYAWSRTSGGHTLLNCGAVGNPLDEPTASYILLDDSLGELRWELLRVAYDIEGELSIARELEMPAYDAWAHELRTGEYAGRRNL